MLILRSLTASLLILGVLAAQEPQQPFVVTTNVVVAPTVVTDKHGDYVNGLQPSDFQLLDNDKPQNLKVDVTWVPISLVVAIQANSTSEPSLAKIKKIGSLLQGLVVGEQGEVAILAFDHRVQVLQDFTSDGDKISTALEKLKAGSTSSALVDAVSQGARMLARRPQERRRVMLLISEARDMGSQGKARQTLTDLQMGNVAVYSVNINRMVGTLLAKPQAPRPDPIPPTARMYPAGVPPTPQNAAALSGNATNSGNFIPLFVEIFRDVKGVFVDNPVEVFTKWTGGKERAFIRQGDLENSLRAIGEELHSEYMLSYRPNNTEEAGFHEIRVVVRGRTDVKIRTRPGYWAAAKFTK